MDFKGTPNYDFKWHDYVPVLPFTYDDCLSYLETLNKFSNKLNEIIDRCNEIVQYGLDEAKAYTDMKVAEQTEYVEQAVTEVERLKNEMEAENQHMVEVMNAKMTIMLQQMSDFEAEVRADVASANAYTDLAILQNNEYIIEHLAELLGDITVINYFTGNRITIQNMFDFLAQLHTENSITYMTLASRECDYDTLIDYHMTYTQLVMNGGSIIQ